jgi:hypothetical protein
MSGHFSQGTSSYGTAAGLTVEHVTNVRAAIAAGPRYPLKQHDLEWCKVQIDYMQAPKPSVGARDVCDFCLGREPVYVHETFLFSVPGRGHGFVDYVDDGQWVACENCHWLVVNRDLEGILRRGPQGNPDVQAHRRVMISVALEHLTGWFWAG